MLQRSLRSFIVERGRLSARPFRLEQQAAEPDAKALASHALTILADRVQRLLPSSHEPHRFHEEKSEIVAELLRLASAVEPKVAKTIPSHG